MHKVVVLILKVLQENIVCACNLYIIVFVETIHPFLYHLPVVFRCLLQSLQNGVSGFIGKPQG